MTEQKTALLMVYHKEGIVEFARRLLLLGWRLLASGGTAGKLSEANLPVINIASLVGEPILGHRVVSISREIHAGLLALNSEEHQAELERHGISWIDLVCVNLYPLEEEIMRPGATLDSILELEDIGGPTVLSSAAKGERIAICDPADYEPALALLEAGSSVHTEFREYLAAKADFIVSRYRMLTARYRGRGAFEAIHGTRSARCLYGENAYQAPAALYSSASNDSLALEKFELVEGVPLSYNNFCDFDRLLQTMTHAAAAMEVNGSARVPFIALAVKHGNCCAAAWSDVDPKNAIMCMLVAGDRDAIMGGLVMTNFQIRKDEADILAHYQLREGENRRILDAVFAPAFTEDAREELRRKKDKCRFCINPALAEVSRKSLDRAVRFRYVRGGFLTQPNYTFVPNLRDSSVVTCRGNIDNGCLLADLAFAWAIGATANSNTIALVRAQGLIGLGVGQQSRIGAVNLAIERAAFSGHSPAGSVAYGDSFFPFDDAPRVLLEAGVLAIFTSEGGIHFADTVKACEEYGVPLLTVPDALGRGFFGH